LIMAAKTSSCESSGKCSGGAKGQLDKVPLDAKHKIIVMSGKGGVGKSTVAVNLAVSLADKGYSVGLLDADMHGPSVPKLLGLPNLPLRVNEKGDIVPAFVPPNLKVISVAFLLRDRDSPVVWRGPLKMGAIRQFLEEVEWGHLDYLIVDLPPGTGDEPLSIAQLIPSPDGALIVTTPQDVALLSVRKSINFARMVGLEVLGLVENMSGFKCPECGKEIAIFGNGAAKQAAAELGVPLIGSLPLSMAISKSGDDGRPFVRQDTDGVKEKFEKMAKDLVIRLEKKQR